MITVPGHPIFDPDFLNDVSTISENARRYVYHYTRWERLLDIEHSGFRLGSLANMNDPRESKDWQLSVLTAPGVSFSGWELLDKAVANYKTSIRIGSFTKDNPYGDEKNFGRRGYGHPRMWAQYADNHTGVCIIFDSQKLHLAIRERYPLAQDSWIICDEVKYIESAQQEPTNLVIEVDKDQSIETAVRDYFANSGQKIFFTKHIDWQDEQECRWVYYTETAQDDAKVPFADVRDAVVGLVLGADFDPAHLPVAQRFADAHGLNGDVVQCRWERLHLRFTVFAEKERNWIPMPTTEGRIHLSAGPATKS